MCFTISAIIVVWYGMVWYGLFLLSLLYCYIYYFPIFFFIFNIFECMVVKLSHLVPDLCSCKYDLFHKLAFLITLFSMSCAATLCLASFSFLYAEQIFISLLSMWLARRVSWHLFIFRTCSEAEDQTIYLERTEGT